MEIGGDVASASAAIAGLLLVYIGSLSASFASYQPTERRTVIGSYRVRVWFAVIGFVFSLFAVALAILGKWLADSCVVVSALILLLIALVWVLVTGVLTALEIR